MTGSPEGFRMIRDRLGNHPDKGHVGGVVEPRRLIITNKSSS
jgi:hypothetical protein